MFSARMTELDHLTGLMKKKIRKMKGKKKNGKDKGSYS